MAKVKIFNEYTIEDLEQKINKFIENTKEIYKVEDIKLAVNGKDSLNNSFSAMIIYQERV